MSILKKNKYNIATMLSAFGAVELMSLIKINYLVGSKLAFFSGTNIALPLAGFLGGTPLAIGITFLRSLSRWLLLGSNPLSFLFFHIPGVVAAFYWRTSSRIIKIGLPLICMIAFVAHTPSAWMYSLYWLIPMGIHLSKQESMFFKALAATFVAHAVGSVIWAYSFAMASATWLALIPVVAVERLLFASAMCACYAGLKLAGKVWNGLRVPTFGMGEN